MVLDNDRSDNHRGSGPVATSDADDWYQFVAGDSGPSRFQGDLSEFPTSIDPDLDPRWSVQIRSAEDDGFVSDYLDDGEDEFDDWTGPGLIERSWIRIRTAPLRVALGIAIVALIGVGLRFGVPFDGGEDLAAVGLEADTTTSVPATTPTTTAIETLAGPGTTVASPGLPESTDPDPDPDAASTEAGSEVDAEGPVDEDAPPAAPDAAEPGATSSGTDAGAGVTAGSDYASNLRLIQGQTVRNKNEDDSPYRNTPSANLVPENHYGPRSEYLPIIDGNKEPSFPVPNGGQFRVACEFSHFAYDDPLVFPNQPGASHLHMFFGNTDANAFSTADSIKNSGGATCNGSELNRTAYWVPALFDTAGSVRIPERIVVYYKGEGLARGKAEVFPEGAAMIASVNLNTIDPAQGGARGKFSYNCANNYSGVDENLSNTMPACDGNRYINQYGVNDPYMVLEVNVKFPQCWNGKEPGNPANFSHPRYAGWYGSVCDGEFNRTLVNLEYFVNYRIEPGENTDGWYLSSDVSPTERALTQTPGSTIHGDWWGGWHTETNQMFIDNCVNYSTSAPSGCGFGYLTDGGPNNATPYDGPALKLRDQYLGPLKVGAQDLHRELCPGGATARTAAAAAYCNPVAPTTETSLFCNVHQGMYASDPRSPLNV